MGNDVYQVAVVVLFNYAPLLPLIIYNTPSNDRIPTSISFTHLLHQVAGVVLFNYAFSVTVPSWLNEKRSDVSVNQVTTTLSLP